MTTLNEREQRQLAEIEHGLAVRYPDLPHLMAGTYVWSGKRLRRVLTVGLAGTAIVVSAAVRAWPVCAVLLVLVLAESVMAGHRRREPRRWQRNGR